MTVQSEKFCTLFWVLHKYTRIYSRIFISLINFLHDGGISLAIFKWWKIIIIIIFIIIIFIIIIIIIIIIENSWRLKRKSTCNKEVSKSNQIRSLTVLSEAS